VTQFGDACQTVLPQCAAILTNSQHTARQVQLHVARTKNLPMTACRLGDIESPAIEPVTTPAIAPIMSKRFVLFVASREARKNHPALLAAWGKLERRYGERTPLLVLVGRGTPDLAAARTHVVAYQNLTDAEREALYGVAWMTAYPSLDEGYGLPVAEALARGRIVLASDAGGLAEIAPGMIDLIDPNDPATIADTVGSYLDEPERHLAREAAIRRHYRRTSWAETVGQVSAVLDAIVQPAPIDRR